MASIQTPELTPNTRADRVCSPCKLAKRRCDKKVPSCSQCIKTHRFCAYTTRESAPNRTFRHVEGFPQYPAGGNASIYKVRSHSLDYSTVLFLAPNLLRNGAYELPRPHQTTPDAIIHMLGSMDQIGSSVQQYFQHVHHWMPIISKQQFSRFDYTTTCLICYPDLALLLLSIKLIVSLPDNDNSWRPTGDVYHAAKSFCTQVEGCADMSLSILQAQVLLALYEIGHGIYPAAFLTVGVCARYAHALGISFTRVPHLRKALTLVEAEERRRVWWAIVILDRFISIGCPGRQFATEDPDLDDLLPVRDALWNGGDLGSSRPAKVSSPTADHMNNFALLCQAARLLGQVLRNVGCEQGSLSEERTAATQLDRTLQSMLAASLEVDLPDFEHISFIYSTLVAIHIPWLYSPMHENSSSNCRQRAQDTLHFISHQVRENVSIQEGCFNSKNPADSSPWGLFFAYHLCRYHRQSTINESESRIVVDSLLLGFQKLSLRWYAAKVYIQLLEAEEVDWKY